MTFQTQHIFSILVAAILKVANNYVLWLYISNNISISITDSCFCDMPTMKVQIIPLNLNSTLIVR